MVAIDRRAVLRFGLPAPGTRLRTLHGRHFTVLANPDQPVPATMDERFAVWGDDGFGPRWIDAVGCTVSRPSNENEPRDVA